MLAFVPLPGVVPAGAQVAPLINYQGRLVNSNNIPLATGDYELRFSIWDAAAGGTHVWGPQVSNDQTGPGLGPKTWEAEPRLATATHITSWRPA